jgi:hypothetical protein
MEFDENVLGMEKELEIKALRTQITDLEKEVTKYKILMQEAEIEVNGEGITDEEIICVQQIAKLRAEASERDLSKDEVQKFDILHKNLKLARGEDTRVKSKSRASKATAAELEEALKG